MIKREKEERIKEEKKMAYFEKALPIWLEGRECTVDFYKYTRPEQKFTSFEALKAQIRKDIQSGKEYFQNENISQKTLRFESK